MSKLFEAFFWIEPQRPDVKSAFKSTSVVWHYPDDVSDVSREFRDIPQFCFPDLEKVKLEKADRCKNEYFTFTLTDSEGKRVYGVCLRSLFRGECRRHDVRRRPKQCLCIITRQPFFRLYRAILLEVHALGLIDPQGANARSFVELIFNQAATAQALFNGADSDANAVATAAAAAVWSQIGKIVVARQALPALNRDFSLVMPLQSAASISQNKEVSILPLLEVLGIEKFMLVLSAVMCERRVIFIADEVGTLSSSVLAAAAMLHPFNWQHVFIPLLPSKLLSYAAAPMPYLIGVRRYLTDRLGREALEGVVIVDVDNGDCRVRGDVTVKDFVGESGSTMKQASENFDRVRKGASGMASFLARAVTGESLSDTSSLFADTGPKDMVASMVTELKNVLAAKPGSSSVVAVASGLLRSLPGGAKMTAEESKVLWSLESEKILRDVLLQFYVYLFADLEDFALPSASALASTSNRSSRVPTDGPFSEGDSRACFDLRSFQQRRALMGDTQDLQEFVSEFLHSQMFERFCDERLKKMKSSSAANGSTSRKSESTRSNTASAGTSSSVWSKAQGLPSSVTGSSTSFEEEEDDYEAVCTDIRKNKMQQTTVAAVKAAVAARAAVTAASLQVAGEAGTKGFAGMGFHATVLQYTAGAREISSEEASPEIGGGGVVVDRICQEASHSDSFTKIMHTISLRLEGCRAALGRGSSGVAGVRALNLLRALLICGPEAVLSASLDFIPVIRALLRNANKDKDGAAQAIEYMSLGAAIDVRPSAHAVLSLLLDHKKLYRQRVHALHCRQGAYVYLLLEPRPTPLFSHPSYGRLHKSLNDALRKDLLPNGPFGSKQFPDISSVHELLRPPGVPAFDPSILKLTTPVAASSEGREVDDDDTNQTSQHEGDDRESEKVRRSAKATQPAARSSPATSLKASSAGNSNRSGNGNGSASASSALLLPLEPFALVNPFEAFAPSVAITNNASTPLVPIAAAELPPSPNKGLGSARSTTSSGTPIANLLDDVDEDAKYRIINRDTGEVMDLRDLENLFKSPSTTVAQAFATTPIKPRVPILAPPVQPALVGRNSPRSPHGRATDPFASTHVSGFADPWATSAPLIPNKAAPSAAASQSDAFGFPVLQPSNAATASSASSASFPSSSSASVLYSDTAVNQPPVIPFDNQPLGLNRRTSSTNPIHHQPMANPFAAFTPPGQTYTGGAPLGTMAAAPIPPKVHLQPQRGLPVQTKDPFADLVGDLKK